MINERHLEKPYKSKEEIYLAISQYYSRHYKWLSKDKKSLENLIKKIYDSGLWNNPKYTGYYYIQKILYDIEYDKFNYN